MSDDLTRENLTRAYNQGYCVAGYHVAAMTLRPDRVDEQCGDMRIVCYETKDVGVWACFTLTKVHVYE